ncbi:hypothetical protein OH492_04435 [Vibrio chagasii]|nr:hypothetical protein [Vibrio chagasii]
MLIEASIFRRQQGINHHPLEIVGVLRTEVVHRYFSQACPTSLGSTRSHVAFLLCSD